MQTAGWLTFIRRPGIRLIVRSGQRMVQEQGVCLERLFLGFQKGYHSAQILSVWENPL